MKPNKAILIILLTTATLAVATERNALWTAWGAIDPWTFEVLFSFEPDPEIRYGTAFDDGYLWHRTDENGVVNYYYKLDFDGNIITSFPSPEVEEMGMVTRGVDMDGEYLWITCNYYVYHVTDTGSIIEPAPIGVGHTEDIAWDGTYLWKVETAMEGAVITKFNVNTGDAIDGFWVPYGSGTWRGSIAADSEYLYVEYGNNGYEWEPYGYYVILTHDGEEVHYYESGNWTWGWDIAEWAFVSIEPASLGTIKALYK